MGAQSRLYRRGSSFIGKASDIHEFQRRVGVYSIIILTTILCILMQLLVKCYQYKTCLYVVGLYWNLISVFHCGSVGCVNVSKLD